MEDGRGSITSPYGIKTWSDCGGRGPIACSTGVCGTRSFRLRYERKMARETVCRSSEAMNEDAIVLSRSASVGLGLLCVQPPDGSVDERRLIDRIR